MMKFICKTYLLILFVLQSFFAVSQGSATRNSFSNTNWSATGQASRVFIENKGQFPKVNNAEVKYAFEGEGTKIYFSSIGLTYSFYERIVDKDEEREREERGHESNEKFKNIEDWIKKEREENKIELKKDFVYLTWENANPNAEIVATEKTEDYYSYNIKQGNEINNINYIQAFKKITYKNLYPNIDVEYTFHPTDGIKYVLILHSGADVSQVKMSYSDVKKISIQDNGDLHIKTAFGNIIDHAPVSFYESNKSTIINSRFVKTEKTVSFQIDNYDNTKALIIDPWTQTPSINNSKGIWECERDGAGNVYIIAGDSPMKLLKYNSVGALQWTYVTPYDTASGWLGTLATDLAGNSYVTMGSTAGINKVNAAGSSVYNVTGGGSDEYWDISFNCDQTKLIVGGTRLNAFPTIKGYGTIFDINAATGAVTATKNVGYTTPGGFGINNPDEVRAITSSHNAKYYYLTLDSLGAIDQNFSACPTATTLFKINNSYALGYKCEDWRPKGNSGICAIKANKNFLYTQNGTTVHKRSLATGAILASAPIAGGVSSSSFGTNQPGNSGIDIDSCGNIYVGSSNAVIMYDANLNVLSSAATTYKVYDIAVSTGGNVIACGATGVSTTVSRIGTVQSFAMGACDPSVLFCCDATICPVGPFCNTSPSVTLSPVTAGGTWSGAGVNALGVFNPATAGTGTHTVIYTLACGKDSISIVVNACASLSVCATGSNLTVSGGTAPYTWQTQQTTSNCTACIIGCNFPPGCSVTATSWSTAATGTNTFTPNSYPVKVFDNAGNTYTVTSLASAPSCTTSSCTTPTVSVSSTTSVTCFGTNTGAATVTATPAGTYTYTWQPGNLTGASQSGLAAGVYTVSAVSGACTGSITVNITQPAAALTTSITATSPASCGQNNGSITVSASDGTPGYTYTWSPSGGNTTTANNLAGGSYTVSILDANSCTTSATASVSTTTNPSLTVNSETVCAGSTTTLTVSGASTYSWTAQNPTDLNSATGATVTATPTTTAIYTVTGTAGTCSATTTATVTVISNPTITVNSATICAGNSATLTASGATSYTWSPSTDLSSTTGVTVTATPTTNATYTITGSVGTCAATPAIATVSVNTVPTITVVPNSASICLGDSAALSVSGTSSYTWTPSTGLSSTTSTLVMASPANTTTYTVIGASNCSASVVLTVNPLPIFTVNSATICAGSSATLTASSNTPTYTWSPATGLSATSGSVVTANPSSNQTYTITGSLGTCTATAIATVSVNLIPTLTLTPSSAAICLGDSAALRVSGASSYSWAPSTGLSSTTSTLVMASPANTTTYTVLGTSNNCSSSASLVLTVNPMPIFTVNSASICAGNPTVLTASSNTPTYTWSPATGLSATSGSVVTANPSSNQTYTIMGSLGTCTSTAIATVSVTPNPTVTVNSATVCAGSSAALTAAGANSYVWSPSTGLSSTTTSVVAVNPTNTTTYTVIGSVSTCTNVTTAIVTVNALPIVSAGLDAAICKGDSTHLLATGADTYVWTPAAGLNNNSIANPSASPGSSTNYTVVGTNTVTGCTKADVVIVTTSTIQATLSADPIAGDAPLTVTFGTNGGASSYHWNYGNGTILNAGDTTQTIYVNQGTYTASVIETSAAGCKDSAYIIILVSEGYSIVIPNIITPNGDNTNDYFFVKHQGISALEMVIYDRWGLQMWQSSSLNGTWDGRHGGKEVPDGTYFYLIKATSSKANTTKEYQGFITLIK